MKGVSTALMILLVVALSVITALGMYFSVIASNLENIRRSIIERGIVAEINEVEFLKQNLHQALDYSFYQSKYEVAGLGGYTKLADAPIGTHNNLPYWRVYDKSHFPPYQESLSDRILEIYNMYSDSITTEISKPVVSKLTVEKAASNSDYASVTAFSDKPIKLEKPNLTIEEDGTINEIIQTNIFNQFDVGKNNFVDRDSILQTVSDAIKDAKLEGVGSLTYHCTRYPTDEEVFEDTNNMPIGDAENRIKNLIKDKIADLEKNLNVVYESKFDIHLIFTDADIKSKVETTCKGFTGDSDPCKKCCCDELGNDWNCGTWYRKDCKFHYFGATRVLVDITDKTKTYAVYDEEIGTNDLRNIQLKFYVLSGNKELITP
jgi:hypothetical protein